jgi:2-polyprenyl-6-methoxyphenol hydroxylase-like FAD-dependent oxidoreductase
MKPPHVLIAGAGIGGLTAALSLLRKGIDCDVYELMAPANTPKPVIERLHKEVVSILAEPAIKARARRCQS